MSSVTSSPSRLRAPRLTGAVEKARLSLVPARRVRAPRAPFAVLVFLILGAGVVGLLMFNTHMQQSSFYATELQKQADDLTAQKQRLDMELEELRNPQHLAAAAKELGMVAPPVPLFVNLGDGSVEGTPTVATPEDGISINPPPAVLPAPLKPNPIVIRVRATPPTTTTSTTTTSTSGQSGSATGPASAATDGRAGRNNKPAVD